MELLTEKRGNNEFFSCIVNEDEMDDFACQMFGANEIPFLVPFSVMHRDGRISLEYNVSGLKTLDSLVTSIVTRKRLISILSGFINAYSEVEDYMLDMDKVLLDEEHVYYNRITESLRLIYLPINHAHTEDTNPIAYMADILKNLRFDARDTALEDSVQNIINEIEEGNINSISGLKDFQHELNLLDGDSSALNGADVHPYNDEVDNEIPIEKKSSADTKEAEHVESSLYEDKRKKGISLGISGLEIPGKKKKNESANQPKKGSFSFSIPGKDDEIPVNSAQNEAEAENKVEEKADNKKRLSFSIPGLTKKEEKKPEPTNKKVAENKSLNKHKILDVDIPDDDNEGTVYGKAPVKHEARLSRLSDGKIFAVRSNHCTVGRSKNADCVIDNPQISREHALIEFDGESYYISDLNSSNHTYVDGKELIPNKRVLLHEGAQIRLSKEVYIFNA